jgi:hypothetical protein
VRRKFVSFVVSCFVILFSWAIPKYLEVNNVITQQNSYWLLYSVFIGIFFVACVLIYGYWPEIKKKIWGDALTSNLYNQISLACHIWKNAYLFYYPGHFHRGERQYLDVWELMGKTGNHIYSEQEWLKYRPLFDQVLVEVINKLLEVIKLFPDSIDESFKMQVYQTIEQLKLERDVYLQTPSLIGLFTDKDQAFNVRFLEVIRVLAALSRDADKIYLKNRPKK